MPIYHVWFGTKRRRWLLQGEVLDVAREEIALAAGRNEIRLIEHECIVDHTHLLLEVEEALSRAMHHIKGASARRIFQRLPDLKMDAGVNSFWQARYGFKVIEPAAVPVVREYIRTQWERLEGYRI